MWGFTPFLNWADILTVERAMVVLVKFGRNRDDRRESGRDPQSRFGPLLGPGLVFFKNSFAGRLVGTVPITERDFGAIQSPVEVSMSRKRWKKQLFGLFAPLRSAPSPPILAQIWIFLAQNLGNYVVVYPLLELG